MKVNKPLEVSLIWFHRAIAQSIMLIKTEQVGTFIYHIGDEQTIITTKIGTISGEIVLESIKGCGVVIQ